MGTGRIKLFRAHSIIDRFPCGTKLFNGVLVHWFVYRREFPIGAREKYIANYRERYEDEERRLYAEEAIDELFTEEEAIGLKYYLLATQGIKCEIEEAEMPISFGSCGFGAHAVGGPYGYL